MLYVVCMFVYQASSIYVDMQGRIQDFKLGGAHLKKLRREEGGAKIFGVFRVKNHDFTPKNHIFSNFRRGRVPGAPPPPPGSAPDMYGFLILNYYVLFYMCCTLYSCYVMYVLFNV